jgi:hypothetical protein
MPTSTSRPHAPTRSRATLLIVLIVLGIASVVPPGIDTAAAQPGGVAVVLGQWSDMIRSEASDAGIPWQVVASLVIIESGGNADARSANGGVGLMLIRPDVFPEAADANLTDPQTNLRVGANILANLYQQWGTWQQVVAAYTGRIDAEGNIVDTRDDHGWTGREYVTLFERQIANLGYAIGPVAQPWTVGGAQDNPLHVALTALGTPYIWGGESYAEGGFDCSGLVQWAWAQVGISLPRTAAEQWNATTHIAADQVQPGDLIFFYNTDDQGPGIPTIAQLLGIPSPQVITHVGIYAGNGLMLHAPKPGDHVRLTILDTPYWRVHLAGYGRP